MAKFEHKFIHSGVSNDAERSRFAGWLDNHSADGWTIVTADFTPGGVFDVLLKRPLVEEKK